MRQSSRARHVQRQPLRQTNADVRQSLGSLSLVDSPPRPTFGSKATTRDIDATHPEVSSPFSAHPSRRVRDYRAEHVRTEADVDFVRPRDVRIETDSIRPYGGAIERHHGHATRQSLGILDDHVDALSPEMNPCLEPAP